jgi:hypothetical protein
VADVVQGTKLTNSGSRTTSSSDYRVRLQRLRGDVALVHKGEKQYALHVTPRRVFTAARRIRIGAVAVVAGVYVVCVVKGGTSEEASGDRELWRRDNAHSLRRNSTAAVLRGATVLRERMRVVLIAADRLLQHHGDRQLVR